MERGNGNTVLLTVIGVATLLVALVGATFAYFTATITGNTNNVEVTTTKLADLTMTQYNNAPSSSAIIYPGWQGYQAFVVSATGDGSANYNLSVSYTNDSTSAHPTSAEDKNILDEVEVLWCKQLNQAANSAVTSFVSGFHGSELATPITTNETTVYSMTTTDNSLPTGCTNVLAANATLNDNGTITLASAQAISASKFDLYYIIYKYKNESSAQTQGLKFTATPAFSVAQTTYVAP